MPLLPLVQLQLQLPLRLLRLELPVEDLVGQVLLVDLVVKETRVDLLQPSIQLTRDLLTVAVVVEISGRSGRKSG
jgi:hypothetical protein